MENLLNNIQDSEKNDPMLKAAFEEIQKLQLIIEDIKSVAYSVMASYMDDEGTIMPIAPEDQDSHKIATIQSLVLYNYI